MAFMLFFLAMKGCTEKDVPCSVALFAMVWAICFDLIFLIAISHMGVK